MTFQNDGWTNVTKVNRIQAKKLSLGDFRYTTASQNAFANWFLSKNNLDKAPKPGQVLKPDMKQDFSDITFYIW